MHTDEMTVSAEQVGSRVAQVVVRGDIDMASATRLEQALRDAMHQGEPSTTLLLVDLSGVSFMDSSGLRVLARMAAEMAGNGHRLACTGLSPAVERLLEITGMLEELRARVGDVPTGDTSPN
jgi:anti-sigma B factor antagonist